MPCVAKYEEDDLWYRAQVRSYTSRDVDVFFVDYGNTQSAARSAIFELDPKFISKLEAQAVQCQLDVYEGRNPDAMLDKFNTLTEDEELQMVVKSREGSKLMVDLLRNGTSVTEELKSGAPVNRGNQEKSGSGYTPGTVSPGQTVSAFTSFIESPSKFWVQLAGCDDELTFLMETLSKHYGSGTEPPLVNPVPGQPCVALYDEDKQWYRAAVLSVHGTEVKVQFVDYGNCELVDRQKIKSISAGFMSSPLLAIECCLDKFQSGPVSDDIVVYMESLVSEQEIAVTFHGPKNVSVKVGDKDLATALQEKGFGSGPQKSPPQTKAPPTKAPFGGGPQSPPSLSPAGRSDNRPSSAPTSPSSLKFKDPAPPSGSAEAIITHVDNENGIFYIQLLSSESQLQQLSSKLQTTFSSGGSNIQGPLVKGMACCAKFKMDGCWYRAVVDKVSGRTVTVQFVDYGNSDTVQNSDLKCITPDFLGAPVHAFPCRLKGLHSWAAQTAKAFTRLAMDEELKVRFVTLSPPFDIQVSVKGQDLLQLINKSPVSSPQSKFGPDQGSGGSRTPGRQQQAPAGNKFGSAPSRPFGERPQQPSFTAPPSAAESWDDKPSSRNTPPRTGASRSTPPRVQLPEQVFQKQQAPSGEEAAYVSCVAEDGTFFLQLVKDIDAIDELTSKVEKAYLGRHPNPAVGAACGAQFSEDQLWYRGVIKSRSGSSVDVLFVDFGNGEAKDIGSLKPLPTELLTPALAYQCHVEGMGLLTPEQQEAFKAASEDKEYLVSFKNGVPFDVVIKDESGTNLADTIFKPTSIRPAKVPTEMVQAVVAHVGDDGHFYLHLCSTLDALADFADELQTVCESGLEKLATFDEGQVCCAKFTEDDAWYRASILKSSEDTVTVLFVDYGNTDTVSKENVLILPPSLMSKPPFAYECRIQGVKRWKENQKEKFVAMTDGKTMNARFLSLQQPYEVELTRSIGLDLVGDESVEETDESTHELEEASQEAAEANESVSAIEKVSDKGEEEFSDAKESPEGPAVAEPVAESGDMKIAFPAQTPPALDACVIGHVDSDGTFYLLLVSEDESRENMSEKLQDECELPGCKTLSPSVNIPCCAKFSEDEAWYRAVVEKVEGERVGVRFVDFGNTDTVPAEELKQVPSKCMQVPPLAYHCMLADCEVEKVTSKLEDATLDQTLTVTFTTTDMPPYTVTLHLENGMDVSTLLGSCPDDSVSQSQTGATNDPESVESNAAVSEVADGRKCIAMALGQRVKVTVSHVVSPSRFYSQLDSNVAQLEVASDAMFEHFSSLAEGDGAIENLTVGRLCACAFGEDESWYRAIVHSIDTDSDLCELFYVDYGNTETVSRSSVRELPGEFQSLPWQCVACCLAGVSCGEGDWSEEANTAFEELVISK